MLKRIDELNDDELGKFFCTYNEAEVVLLKNGIWPIGYFPIVISVLVAFDQYQSNNTN